MSDQADELRQLMRQRAECTRTNPGPRLVAVVGGKGGVGTTTCAIKLALSLDHANVRTLLVDADLNHADATRACGLEDSAGLSDVLSGRRQVCELIRSGHNGLTMLPGVGGSQIASCAPSTHDRLIGELRELHTVADVIILDAGSGLTSTMRRFWHSADHVLVVTTSDLDSIMDSYAAIKVHLPPHRSISTSLLANKCDKFEAFDVHQRISSACQRFLGLSLELAGHLRSDASTAPFYVRDEMQAVADRFARSSHAGAVASKPEMLQLLQRSAS